MSGNSGILEKLKQMDAVARSGIIEIPLRVTWSIPNFLEEMLLSLEDQQKEQKFTIPIIGGQETADICVIVSKDSDSYIIYIEGNVKLPSWIQYVEADIGFGQLTRSGSERMCEFTFCWTDSSTGQVDITGELMEEELMAKVDRLLPDGQLTILVKGKIFALAEILAATCTIPDLMCQMENTMCNVKLDSFVDLGSASVLLVFEDGEERCHTFLLAAR
jgi:hypothetical protein